MTRRAIRRVAGDGGPGVPGSKPARRRRARPWRALARWAAAGAVWALVAVTGLVAWYATDLPDVDAALAASRRPSVTLLAADGTEFATFGELYGPPVPLAELPPALPQAVLAIEDRRFYRHFGLDPLGLIRAAIANARAGRIVQGGSTITQQVAKNLFLEPERTLKRKVQEVILALWLERRLSKDQILTVYFNRVYLGAGAFGVAAAAQRYFGRPARRLNLWQSAMLAGLLKAPSRDNPRRDPEAAERRAEQVLAAMVDTGAITDAQARAARRDAGAPRPSIASLGIGRHFADWVFDQVSDYVGAPARDLVVTTTLDRRLQRLAEEDVRGALAGPGAAAGAGEAALVALAPDGAVRAMVGGRDHASSPFNRATQALRQPGSAFKPLVYLAGLESGMTPETPLDDAPITVDGWSPRNFSASYRGRVTATEALAQSINTVAVRVAERAGRANVVAAARRLGITADLQPTPSLALGTFEVTPLELTAAFAAFADGGIGVWPYAIVEIRDGGGHVLYRRSGSGPGRVVAPREIAAINTMLTAVIAEGTGRAARLDRPAAGKTGTSQDFRDAWFVGYTAELVTGVWMGNDDGRPMKGVTGGGLPARLWREFMAQALEGVPTRALPGLEPAPDAPADGFWRSLIARITGPGG